MREDSNAESLVNAPALNRKGSYWLLFFVLLLDGTATARGQTGVSVLLGGGAAYAHAVEGAVDEDEGDYEKGGCQDVRQVASLAGGELDG